MEGEKGRRIVNTSIIEILDTLQAREKALEVRENEIKRKEEELKRADQKRIAETVKIFDKNREDIEVSEFRLQSLISQSSRKLEELNKESKEIKEKMELLHKTLQNRGFE